SIRSGSRRMTYARLSDLCAIARTSRLERPFGPRRAGAARGVGRDGCAGVPGTRRRAFPPRDGGERVARLRRVCHLRARAARPPPVTRGTEHTTDAAGIDL